MRNHWIAGARDRLLPLRHRLNMRLLRFAVSIGVLVVLFMLMDTQAILTRLRGAHLGWLGAALGALTVLTLLMAWRWQMAAHALSIPLGYGRAVSEYYIAQLLNLVLPGGMVGDAARAARLKAPGASGRGCSP